MMVCQSLRHSLRFVGNIDCQSRIDLVHFSFKLVGEMHPVLYPTVTVLGSVVCMALTASDLCP